MMGVPRLSAERLEAIERLRVGRRNPRHVESILRDLAKMVRLLEAELVVVRERAEQAETNLELQEQLAKAYDDARAEAVERAERLERALRDVRPFVKLPSDEYAQHQEALGLARKQMDAVLVEQEKGQGQ